MKRSSILIIACVAALVIATAGVAMHVRQNSPAAVVMRKGYDVPLQTSSSAASALPAANVDFEQVMLKIAGNYKRYQRVDHTMVVS